jgi:small subunit ribosomal protein S17
MAENIEHKSKKLRGTVVSDKMTDSAVVSVVRYEKHPRYTKFIKTAKKYLVHNPGNKAVVGDKVEIKEIRPMSKRKHFAIVDDNA